jgi:hypothetical protein
MRAARARPSLVGGLALAGPLALTGTLLLAGVVAPIPGATSRAAAQPAAAEPMPHTDASVPASDVTMIGATPLEAPGSDETWGVGKTGSTTVLVRYAKGSGWSLAPALPAGFALGQNPLAGQMTPRGDGVLAGTAPSASGHSHQVLLVGRPGAGHAFTATAPIPAQGEPLLKGEEPLLHEGEVLFGAARAPLIAPLDEADGEAGALVAPIIEGAGVENQVLHWDGHAWSSEPIEIPAKSASDFHVLGIGASSPTNAFLLAQLSSKSSYPAGAVALFRRVPEGGAKWSWKPIANGAEAGEAEPLTVPLEGTSARAPFTVAGTGEPPTVIAQLLTVTGEGVWIDGQRADVHTPTPASTTLFFQPEGATGGQVQASWCLLPAGAEGALSCQHELPEAIPAGFSRSIAWSTSATGQRFGERVITGLAEGVSLRLDGETFTRVLALGAGSNPNLFPGALRGAAFTSSREGWLGAGGMPVHLTLEPMLSRLAPWPVPFRHALLAIAPQPGVPVGASFSEALAVGDYGAVARFKPGEGWLPESLFGPGGRVEYPRLRAVAWPTPSRAFAVGDDGPDDRTQSPVMWLWRAESGLWEPDPATPLNFRGNLLGIAFDPNNPARGYAVGSGRIAGAGGVLLRYGKTWTQETALPPQIQGASFIGVAFAGSEAIVAYRQRPSISENRAAGGLLVNDGSGWRVDEGAAAAMGTGVPVAVAGLPDGGAAFATVGGADGPRVYERESAGSPWQPSPTPLPGSTAGKLSLFREGGGLRAIVSAGAVSNESEPPAPAPGFPPSFLEPFPPVAGGPESGGVLRQTATGWSDESHELNPASEPQGSYTFHDLPYRPDPILAVLVDTSGAQGWAVGGSVSTNERLETGDVERYPADGSKPLGEGESRVSLLPAYATFAIGGGAQCAAPCADRAQAKIGPDVWLSKALALVGPGAGQIGARAFLYAGPRVSTAETDGPKTQPIPFPHELARYAQILGSSPSVFAAVSPYELNARPERNGTEATFESAFAGFPQASLSAGDGEKQGCHEAVGCQTAYYAFDSAGPGGPVRVIVLDDSSDVDPVQLGWLEGQLQSAKTSPIPAIVLGNADLSAQIAAGDVQAGNVASALVLGGASAYFYDSPEENVTKSLRAGGESIPAFGSGTLGYVNVNDERFGDFHGASGFLLGQVDVSARNPASNRAPVTVRLIPDIGELALEAKDGILLRRSSPALFAGLARRPRAGGRAVIGSQQTEVDPYIPIPENCVGAACASAIFPEYTFSSSRIDLGVFVEPNLASPNPHAVLQNAKGEPIPDEPRNAKGELTSDGQFEKNSKGEPINEKGEVVSSTQSGLFCAYNPGTTIVTISAGGLTSSLPVTVQAGSVRQPCGTVPLKNLSATRHTASAPVPAPAPAPAPAGSAPASSPPPVPLPPPPIAALVPPNPPTPAHPTPFFVPLPPPTPVLAFLPPPPPTPARPTPPSGTSAVTSPVEVAEHEEEDEEATESVSNQAVAYHSTEHELSPAYILGIVLLAAFAGASLRGRPRRGRRELRIAPATISTIRGQRRMSSDSRRPRR